MALLKKTKRSEQPGAGVGIDAAHPLASSLVLQWAAKQGPVETKTGAPAPYTATKLASGAYVSAALQAIEFNGSTAKVSFGSPAAVAFGSSLYSIELLVNIPNTATQQSVFEKDDQSSNRQLFCQITGSSTLRFGWSNNAGGYTLLDTSSSFPTGRYVHVLCCRTGSTTAAIYFDGVLQSGTYILQTASTVASTSAALQIGQRADAALPITNGGQVALARIYNGDISAWAGSLARNPWQLFKSRRNLVPEAGGASLNLSAATLSVSGALGATGDIGVGIGLSAATAAVSGSVSVSGDLGVGIGIAADPIAVSGAVAVSGDLVIESALDVQADPIEIAGSVSVAGDIAIGTGLDLTADQIAVTGLVTVAGDLVFSDQPVAPDTGWMPGGDEAYDPWPRQREDARRIARNNRMILQLVSALVTSGVLECH